LRVGKRTLTRPTTADVRVDRGDLIIFESAKGIPGNQVVYMPNRVNS
jgi:hypothetical protein